ncbi:MAG: Smr/MutS family protein [Bacteroidota bacterium]
MHYFTEYADKRTLVLIDEFGTGTEPQFGGAIAEAILDSLNKTRCQGVVTTHYSNLKDFAEKQPGLVNAAMRYDTDRLEPLFQLEVGKPGSSFAFEIASKIGIRNQILQLAKKLVGADHVSYDRLLGRLDAEKSKLEKNNKALLEEKKAVLKLREDYEALRQLVEKDKKGVIKEAKAEAAQIIAAANREVERTIREIKEAQAEKASTQEARNKLSTYGEKLQKDLKKKDQTRAPARTQTKSVEGPIQVSDKVRVKGQETVGEVLSLKAKQAEVAFGDLKSFIALSKLEKVSNRQVKKQQKAEVRLSSLKLDKKMADFSHELDVRGKRAEEVLPLVDKKLDDAIVLGISELRVLHGKGHGILKDMIRNHLRGDNHVVNMVDEHADRGGSGVTIITLA